MAANLTVTKVEQDLRLNTVRGPRSKRCSSCGKPYLRRNAMEVWTIQNAGHRYGWHKDIARVCTKCMSESEGERIMGIADVQFSKLVKPTKRR